MSEKNDFLHIDMHRLDREWVKQPELVREWGDKLANARRDFDEAKADLDVIEAELSLSIRAKPKDFGLETTTEASIRAKVITSERYRKQQRKMFQIKHDIDVLQAASNALEHKKRALTMLVELHGRDYFANPSRTTSDTLRDAATTQRERPRAVGKFLRDEDDREDRR